MTSSTAVPPTPLTCESLTGCTFVLHGARYSLGPACSMAEAPALYAVNMRSGLALHVVRPDPAGLDPVASRHLIALDEAEVEDAPAGLSLAGLWLEPAPEVYEAEGQQSLEQVHMGDRYAAGGLASVAAGCYQRALGAVADNTEARHRISTLQLEMQDPGTAAAGMRRVLQVVEPHWPPYYALYLTAAAQAGQFADAAATYARFRALFPHFNGLDAIGAPVLVEAGRPDLAAQVVSLYDASFPNREALDKALAELLPRHPEAESQLAKARDTLFAQGSPQEVSALLAAAHERLPMSGIIAFNLALALQRLERFQESRDLILGSLGRIQAPLVPTALLNLAHASTRLGKLDEAVAQLADTYRAVMAESEGNPLARPQELPALCVWVDEQLKVESPPQAVLELLEYLGPACEKAQVQMPEELPLLTGLYQAAAQAAAQSDAPALGTLADLSDGGVEALAAALPEPAARPARAIPALLASDVRWEKGAVLPGGFEIVEEVGRGAIGSVFLVTNLTTRQFMLAERLDDNTAAQRSALWSGLRVWLEAPLHSSIQACRFVRTVGGYLVVFTEAVQGANLQGLLADGALLQGEGPVLVAQVLSLAAQSAWALEIVHRQRIVHAGVEPASFFVQMGGQVRLGGFWHARMLGEDVARQRHQSEEQQVVEEDDEVVLPEILGETLSLDGGRFVRASTRWMAPETAGGQGLSRATDIWDWAALVLRSMFEGQGVALPATPVEALEAVRAGSLGRLSTIPRALTDLLASCLQEAPEARPQRLGEPLEQLKALYKETFGSDLPGLVEVAEGLRGGFGSTSLPPATSAFGPWAFLRAGALAEPHASIPVGWCDLRHAIAGSYPAEAFEPLLARSFNPSLGATTRGQALSDLAALEEVLENLRGAAPQDADRALELARGLHDRAVLLDTLGDDAGAVASISEAIHWLDSFSVEEDDPDVVLDLINALLVEAVCLARAGRLADAIAAAERALKVAEALPLDDAPDMRREGIARSQVVLGSLLADTEERKDEAIPSIEAGLAGYEALDWKDEVGVAHALKAMVLQKQEDQEAAIASYLVAEKLLAAEVEGDSPARPRRVLAHIWLNTFSLYMHQGELVEAERASGLALGNLIGMVDDDGHAELAGELAAACKARAAIAEMNRDFEQALQLCTRGRQILEMSLFEGGVAGLSAQLALMLRYEGDIFRRAGVLEPATEATRRALFLLEQLASQGDDAAWPLAVAEVKKALGTLLQQQGRGAEALPLLEAAVAAAQASQAFAPLYEAETYAVLGAARSGVGQAPLAYRDFAAGIDKLEEVSEEDADEVPPMLGRLLWFQACSQALRGDFEGAEATFRATLATWEPMAEEEGDGFEDAPALVQACSALAMLARLRGAHAEAGALYARAVEVSERLAEKEPGVVALSALVLATAAQGVFLTTQDDLQGSAEAFARAASVAAVLAEAEPAEQPAVEIYQALAARDRDLLALDAEKAAAIWEGFKAHLDMTPQMAPSGLADALRRGAARASLLGLTRGRLEVALEGVVVTKRLLAFEPRTEWKAARVRCTALVGLALLELGQMAYARPALAETLLSAEDLLAEEPTVACDVLLHAGIGLASLEAYTDRNQAAAQATLGRVFDKIGARLDQQQLDSLNAVKQAIDSILPA